MKDVHIDNMRKVEASIDKAIFDKQDVTIAGGVFGFEELTAVRLALRYCITKHDNDPCRDHVRPPPAGQWTSNG
jgi:hypothetical protein